MKTYTRIPMTLILMSLVFLGFAGHATAALISFTFEGTASGSLDSVDFTDEAFVITATADTDDIQAFGNGVFYDNDLATISLQGNTHTINTPTTTHLNTVYKNVTFGNNTLTYDALIFPDDALSGWDALSSFGPLVGSGFISDAAFPMTTTGGDLEFDNDYSASFTFQATAVPEPSSLALWLGLGLGGVIMVLRRCGDPVTMQNPAKKTRQ